jgi:hypothetical protein
MMGFTLITIILLVLNIILLIYLILKRKNKTILALSIVLIAASTLLNIFEVTEIPNMMSQKSMLWITIILGYMRPIIMLIITTYLLFISNKKRKNKMETSFNDD